MPRSPASSTTPRSSGLAALGGEMSATAAIGDSNVGLGPTSATRTSAMLGIERLRVFSRTNPISARRTWVARPIGLSLGSYNFGFGNASDFNLGFANSGSNNISLPTPATTMV